MGHLVLFSRKRECTFRQLKTSARKIKLSFDECQFSVCCNRSKTPPQMKIAFPFRFEAPPADVDSRSRNIEIQEEGIGFIVFGRKHDFSNWVAIGDIQVGKWFCNVARNGKSRIAYCDISFNHGFLSVAFDLD